MPYVAWVGEQVRLVVCDPAISRTGSGQDVSFAVEEWTGNQDQEPKFDGAVSGTNGIYGQYSPGSVAFFTPNGEQANQEPSQGCVKADIKSVKDGLARIRVNVYDTTSSNRPVVFTHQFLAIWMYNSSLTIHEAAATDFPQSAQANATKYLGDPTGNGSFTPDSLNGSRNTWVNNGLIQIKVKGTFSVLDPQVASFLGASSFTLPDDWVTLATKLARSDDPTNTNGNPAVSPDGSPNLWDIHGTPSVSAVDPHHPLSTPISVCLNGGKSDTTDATDNCGTGNPASPSVGGDNGPFSRVFGDVTSALSIGSFDNERPAATLLSDGRLNPDDAPMANLPITVTIQPNSGASNDIGGVGTITGASKEIVYSRDFTGNATASNLYNPFYNAYVPNTAAPVREASGITGGTRTSSNPPDAFPDNFPGFLNANPYDYWDAFQTFASNTGVDTQCLRRSDSGDEGPTFFQTPSGPTSRQLFTDERGEAYALYTPGSGFFMDNLGIHPDANGACDLGTLLGQPIGTSVITASAAYPYQPVSYNTAAPTPSSITKTVRSLWAKTLSVFGKDSQNPDTQNNVRIVVAHAQDISGEGFANEKVCFEASAATGQTSAPAFFNGTVKDKNGNTIDLTDTYATSTPSNASKDSQCVLTNDDGNAAVEVVNSNGAVVNVDAFFAAEKIYRFQKIDFGAAPQTVDNTQPPNNQAVSGDSGPTVSTFSITRFDSSPGVLNVAGEGVKVSPVNTARAKAHIALARIVLGKHGRHLLVTRLNSKKRTGKIRITLLGKNGRVLKSLTYTVKTNRLVTLSLPGYSAGVAKVNVTVL